MNSITRYPCLPILIERGCLARLAGSRNRNSRTGILSLVPGIMEIKLVQKHLTLIGVSMSTKVMIWEILHENPRLHIFLRNIIYCKARSMFLNFGFLGSRIPYIFGKEEYFCK